MGEIGLLIVNGAEGDTNADPLHRLMARMRSESVYQASCIHVGWSSKRMEDGVFDASVLVNPNLVDGGLAEAVSDRLGSIKFNDTSRNRVAARGTSSF